MFSLFFFRLHDFDNNTKLDGLEILQAIHHSTHGNEEDNDQKDDANADTDKPPFDKIGGAIGDATTSNNKKTGPIFDDFQYFVGKQIRFCWSIVI